MKYLFIGCFFVLFFSSTALAAKKEVVYPGAVNKLYINIEQVKKQNTLANMIGFNLGEQYTYTEYADIKRKYKVGIAGAYDFLLLSTGGTAWDYEALNILNRQTCGWEMTYYSNHELTVVHEVCHSQDRANSFVRILKISKGKNTNLHLE